MSKNSMMPISINCVCCGNEQTVEVDSVGYSKWLKGELIQRALPKAHKFERDVLITHMCYDCLSKTYHRPKPGEDWGEVLVECPCCGADIYERNRNSNGDLVCACCHYNLSEEESDD